MKVKQLLFSVAVPLFLAAVMLALGAVIPQQLLHRHEAQLGSAVQSVPVDDVRPYGDAYAQSTEDLMRAVNILSNAHYAQSGDEPEINPDSMEGFRVFLTQWVELINGMGYGFESLERLEVVELQILYGDLDEPPYVLLLSAVDPQSGMFSSFCVDQATGAPVQIVHEMPWDKIPPDVLWVALLESYAQYCGLTFEESARWMVINGKKHTMDETSYFDDAYNGTDSNCVFEALSSDLTFRLRLSVGAYGGDSADISVDLSLND